MGRLDGKVAVITGAGGGMGREAAIVFAEEGAQVCAADIDGAAAEQVASEAGDALAVQVDVADGASVQAMYAAAAERFGGIDVLYNNAGISPADDDSILETEEDAWDRVQNVNTKGVYLCCKHGIPYLLERGGGSVINVASFVALMGAATSQISYSASKGAVLSMSRELGVQFARQGIRVNALCPGPVETPLLLRIFGDDPAAYERRRIHLPMGRLAKPREIVNAALFLASDESSYVNAATFLVDGGLTAAYVTPEIARRRRRRRCAAAAGSGAGAVSLKYAVVNVAAANGTVRLCPTSEPSQMSKKSGKGAKRSLITPEATAMMTNVTMISPNTSQPWPRTISRERPKASPADLPSITITATSIDQIVSRKRPGTMKRINPTAIPSPARIPATISAGKRGDTA